MASYVVNERAVARARRLIRGRQYVLNSDWGDVQPKAEDENAFLASHSWSEYGEWHLGLTEGASDETKAKYAFVYGDFRRRMMGTSVAQIEKTYGHMLPDALERGRAALEAFDARADEAVAES